MLEKKLKNKIDEEIQTAKNVGELPHPVHGLRISNVWHTIKNLISISELRY